MENVLEINYIDAEENPEIEKKIEKVLKTCFVEEDMDRLNLYVSITLTCPSYIKKLNNEYRNIDRETDVLSFPMFEKDEIDDMVKQQSNKVRDVFGDIVISVERVQEQALEYGHSFERELAYMVVHGFYHLRGYDHMVDDEKAAMREKEEIILKKLNITR